MNNLGDSILKILIILLAFFSFASHAHELPIFFDSGMNGVFLETASEESLINTTLCSNSIETQFCETNTSNTQRVKYTVHPGSLKYAVSLIEIRLISDIDNTSNMNLAGNNEQRDTFSTHKGIYLGLSKTDIIKLLGKPTSNHHDLLTYHSKMNPKLLDRFNMPIYSANYHFKGNRLVYFKFGFEYP